MESGSAKILRYNVKPGCTGRVFCEPLNIFFPVLLRIVQTVTQEQLDAEDLEDEEPIDGFIDYTIDQKQEYLGTIERQPTRGIVDKDAHSIVIRHHHSLSEAFGYVDALLDTTSEMPDRICKTTDGIFTLIRRPTAPCWPGPMVIYMAILGSDNCSPENWQLGISPDGTAIQSNFL